MTALPELKEPELDAGPSTPAGLEPDGELAARLEKSIQEGVTRILAAFEQKVAYDASKQQQVDLLHEELQRHRAEVSARASRPLVRGMIRLHDDIGRLVAALRAKPREELSPENFFALLQDLQKDVELVLGHEDVFAYRGTDEVLDPRRQRVVSTVATGDPRLGGRIAEWLRPGFEQGDRIIEKERVVAYAFEAAPAPATGKES